MIKKTLFGVIGLVGFMVLMFAPSAHAAVSVSSVDQPTRVLLGQTLNVLQSVLNDIQAKVNDTANPLPNPEAVSSALGGIKQVLISIDAHLSGFPAPVAQNQPAALPTGSLEGSGISVASPDKETANVVNSFNPKWLFVLLPVLILVIVAFAFTRRKDEVAVKSFEGSENVKNEIPVVVSADSGNEVQTV